MWVNSQGRDRSLLTVVPGASRLGAVVAEAELPSTILRTCSPVRSQPAAVPAQIMVVRELSIFLGTIVLLPNSSWITEVHEAQIRLRTRLPPLLVSRT